MKAKPTGKPTRKRTRKPKASPDGTSAVKLSTRQLERELATNAPVPPLELEERARRLIVNLRRIRENASLDAGGGYSLPGIAIEGWLMTAIATAEVIEAEARGDVPDPGGDHGGPTD